MSRLRVENLEKKMSDTFTLTCPKFMLEGGDCGAVIGANGSGKSTFLRLLAGLYTRHGGSIELELNQKPIPRENWRHYISYLPENFNLPTKDKIEESLSYFLQLGGVNHTAARKKISDFFEQWNLTSFLNCNGNALSVGTLQQMKIALVLLKPAELYIFDEPFESLDPETRMQAWKQIQTVLEDGSMTVLSVFEAQSLRNMQPNHILRFENGISIFDEENTKATNETSLADCTP